MRYPSVITKAFALLSLSLLPCACDKRGRLPEGEGERSYVMTRVTFAGAPASATKGGIEATGAVVSDDTVESLSVFVYRSATGSLESSVRSEGAVAQVDVPSDMSLQWHVVANIPEGESVSCDTPDELNSSLWKPDSLSAPFAMTGTGSGSFSGGESVSVSLRRLVSRVTLQKVTPAFLGTSYKDASVTLTRVFLLNVAGSCPYSGTPSSDVSLWYNKLTLDASLPEGIAGGLVKDYSLSLSDASSVTLGTQLYCCPNPIGNGIDSSTEPSWSARNTRLIIELSIDGVPNYYPITLPAMSCNTDYVIREAVLLGAGASSPDMPVSRDAMRFSIQVNAWGTDAVDLNL